MERNARWNYVNLVFHSWQMQAHIDLIRITYMYLISRYICMHIHVYNTYKLLLPIAH